MAGTPTTFDLILIIETSEILGYQKNEKKHLAINLYSWSCVFVLH